MEEFSAEPAFKNRPIINVTQYLADIKGWTIDHARQMNNHVTQMAAAEGLSYDFDKAVVANSFDAHRFAHLAKQHGKGDEAEEALFNAYFTNGQNIADHTTLASLGESIGLDKTLVEQTLATDQYAADVHADIQQAQRYGISGVPFFVVDNKYAVSGAQEVAVFLQTLQKAHTEWSAANGPASLDVIDGDSCEVGGDC